MRFILVQTATDDLTPEQEEFFAAGWRPFRATCGESNVDIFFWAPDTELARAAIIRRYPDATFSDLVPS